MTDHPEKPRGKRSRRRAAAPSGHSAVVPASVGQGAQVDVSTTAAKPTKRRGRKRDAAAAQAASTAAVDAAPVAADSSVIATGVVRADGDPAPVAAVPAVDAGRQPGATAQAASATTGGADAAGDAATIALHPMVAADGSPAVSEADPVVAGSDLSGTAVSESVWSAAALPESGPSESAQSESACSESDDRVPVHSESPETTSPPLSSTAGWPGEDHPSPDGGDESRTQADRDAAGDTVGAEPGEGPPREPPAGPAVDARHHRWVYSVVALFLLSLIFGLWGVWATFFAGDDDGEDPASLRLRNERLSQEIATLRRSDQISRDANRDLQRTLAERDEEIAGLRADVAFYERFVGATGQRRGLSVHDLEMQLQNGRAWRFVATLTQNLNRGAVNDGRLTLAVEGTRNGRLERLSWTQLRQQNNAPGVGYSFKYFQQVEGNVILPEGFEPLRVTVRLVPAGGSAVEQSFPWAETVAADPTG